MAFEDAAAVQFKKGREKNTARILLDGEEIGTVRKVTTTTASKPVTVWMAESGALADVPAQQRATRKEAAERLAEQFTNPNP